MQLIAGLGNPGGKYAGNRHNVGFMALDAIAAAHGFSPWRKRFAGESCDGVLSGEKCLLLKPLTYMNESGRALGEAVRFYKLPLSNVLVIHDEIDLGPGKLKMKKGGGNAGHNGLRSISAHIGNDYRRLRIGVGHPGRKELVHAHVLKDFSKADHAWLDPLLDAIAEAAPLLGAGDDARFLNAVTQKTRPAKKTAAKGSP